MTIRCPVYLDIDLGTENEMAEMTAERQAPQQNESNTSPKRRVCFVCTGNTCRSPMAEAVANALAQEQCKHGDSASTEAFSRGLYALENDPISTGAVHALEEAEVRVIEGHDYHAHVAHAFRADEVDSFDLLIGMTGSHVMELLMRYPQAAGKILCMPRPISDPYGGSDAVYLRCLSEITEGVRALLFSEEQI